MNEEAPTVFVVDDDASVRRALQRLLASVKLRVETFASAREFLGCQPARDRPAWCWMCACRG